MYRIDPGRGVRRRIDFAADKQVWWLKLWLPWMVVKAIFWPRGLRVSSSQVYAVLYFVRSCLGVIATVIILLGVYHEPPHDTKEPPTLLVLAPYVQIAVGAVCTVLLSGVFVALARPAERPAAVRGAWIAIRSVLLLITVLIACLVPFSIFVWLDEATHGFDTSRPATPLEFLACVIGVPGIVWVTLFLVGMSWIFPFVGFRWADVHPFFPPVATIVVVWLIADGSLLGVSESIIDFAVKEAPLTLLQNIALDFVGPITVSILGSCEILSLARLGVTWTNTGLAGSNTSGGLDESTVRLVRRQIRPGVLLLNAMTISGSLIVILIVTALR